MSIKIKINWDNENVVSESVRIYRADSAFTKENLPPILAEIISDVYEYEDLTIIKGQTYFYMLSAKLGDQEVFTECFSVIAEKPSIYTKVYYVGTSDSVRESVYRGIVQDLGYEFIVVPWMSVSTIPSNCKLIIATDMSIDLDGFNVSRLQTLTSRFNDGTPLLISVVSSVENQLPQTYPSTLGLALKFKDLANTNSVDLYANTVLSPPFNTSQSALVIRQTNYYMAGLDTVTANAIVFAKKGSDCAGAILKKGAINRNGVASPANVAFTGFAWTRSGQLLNQTGKDLLKDLIKRTVR
ncbi:hypothetical protein [Acinetobacter sp. YH12098]|uniref:hypothetical protein n=1 Tax=Acinetobacter sp. YH12098 TaxID=2601087 RepID=UPI0015D298C3|nr:hypothetical protein [Acinetobacter sp. YH12098]